MRRKLIAANWKMYKTPTQAREFVKAFLPMASGIADRDIVLCPPFVDLVAVGEAIKGSKLMLGAQNMYWQPEGAYTGETSAAMLRAVGCRYVIIGHSERRHYFGESDEGVNQKLRAALLAGLTAIVCVGELLEHREANKTDAILEVQCAAAFAGISAEQVTNFTIAYEPVWAIGTGKTATPEIACEAHRYIRGLAEVSFGKDAAARLRILYGGSVKPENAASLLAKDEIDGALVGGASLDPAGFAAIAKA